MKDMVDGIILQNRPKKLDRQLVKQAREWYKQFTGKYATELEDGEVVELFNELK